MRVLTYNIWDGGDGRLGEIAAVIGAAEPDAVALLEATSRTNVEALARTLGVELVFGEANRGYHVAWLTGLPVRRAANHRRPALAKTLLELELDCDGAPLTLFATHLASRHDPMRPSDEIPFVLEVLSGLGDRPHVLVGDLNALAPGDGIGTPPPDVVARPEVGADPRRAIRLLLEAGYVDCYRAVHGSSPGYTYESRAPWLRLDYVLASATLFPRLRVCDVIRGETASRASDHLPVFADFGPPDEALSEWPRPSSRHRPGTPRGRARSPTSLRPRFPSA